MKTTTEQPACKWNLQWLFIMICTTLVSTLSYGQAGNAPMQSLPNFPGPMAIDGFVTRQGAAGDWLPVLVVQLTQSLQAAASRLSAGLSFN
jgi:hypothetical protein